MKYEQPKKICKVDMRKRKVQPLAGGMRKRRRIASRQRVITYDWKVPKGVTQIRVRVIGAGGGGGGGCSESPGYELRFVPAQVQQVSVSVSIGGNHAPDS